MKKFLLQTKILKTKLLIEKCLQHQLVRPLHIKIKIIILLKDNFLMKKVVLNLEFFHFIQLIHHDQKHRRLLHLIYMVLN